MPRKTMDVPVFSCPYCGDSTSFKGGIGKPRLDKHVEQHHPEKMKEYASMKLDDIRYFEREVVPQGEKPTILSIPREMPTVQKASEQTDGTETDDAMDDPQAPSSQTVSIPRDTEKPIVLQVQAAPAYPEKKQPEQPTLPEWRDSDPAKFLQDFLQYYNFKPLFIKIQVDNVKRFSRLPSSGTLMADMKNMDSGQTNQATIGYIINTYEEQLFEYMKRREELSRSMMQRPGFQMPQDGGWPPGQTGTRGFDTRYFDSQYRQPYDQSYAPPQNSKWAEDRLARLEDELRKSKEEESRQLRMEIEQMRMKLDQASTRAHDPELMDIKKELENQRMETKRISEEYQKEREMRFAKEIEDVKNMQRSSPGAEELKSWINQSIQAEHDRVTARELKDTVREVVGNMTGHISPAEVELQKAKNEFELNKAKLDAEKDKAAMWQDTIGKVAASAGEIAGNIMAGQQKNPMGQQQPQQNRPMENTTQCPQCGERIMFPQGVRRGQCPNESCNTLLEVDGLGRAHICQEPIKKQETTPTPQKPEEKTTESPPDEEEPHQE